MTASREGFGQPSLSPRRSRYDGVAIALHWIIAVAMAAAVAIGWKMVDLPLSPLKFERYALHKSIGLTVLALACFRLVWRATHRPPPLLDTVPAWQHVVATLTHWTLYALMFLLPLSGWAYNSLKGFPVAWFGLFDLPRLVPASEASAGLGHAAHVTLAYLLIVLAAIHAAAAIRHHFVLRDRTLWRMLPIVPLGRTGPAILALALLTLPAAARAAQWTVDPAASRLGFKATQGGASFDGSFAKFEAIIVFDPANLPASSVTATIDVASVSTGAPDRDAELPKPDWFDIPDFPKAVFAASAFTATGGDGYLAAGTLTIRDHKVPVSLPFTLKLDGDTALMDGGVVLDRNSFGIGQGEWAKSDIVGRNVTVIVHIVAKRA